MKNKLQDKLTLIKNDVIVKIFHKYLIYLLLVMFLVYLSFVIWGQILLPYEKWSLNISHYVSQYIELNGKMPLSQEDLVDNTKLVYDDANQLESQIKKFSISYGVKPQDIGEDNLLISGPYSFRGGMKKHYVKISNDWYQLLTSTSHSTVKQENDNLTSE